MQEYAWSVTYTPDGLPLKSEQYSPNRLVYTASDSVYLVVQIVYPHNTWSVSVVADGGVRVYDEFVNRDEALKSAAFLLEAYLRREIERCSLALKGTRNSLYEGKKAMRGEGYIPEKDFERLRVEASEFNRELLGRLADP